MSDPVADAKKVFADATNAAAKTIADAKTQLTKAQVLATAENAGIRRAIAASPLTSVLIAGAIGGGVFFLLGAYIGHHL